MTMPNHMLIQQLADPQTRNGARAELLRRGPAVVDDLLAALATDVEPALRKSILRVLLELKEKRAEDVFRESLRSDDEEIRALAARGLYLVGAPGARQACLATLNDAPDPLHFEFTASVHTLCEMGIAVLPAVLPLLDNPDAPTRQRAQKVLEGVTLAKVTRSVRPRPLSDQAREQWKALWTAMGSYQWNAPEELRKISLRRWREWLEQQEQAVR